MARTARMMLAAVAGLGMLAGSVAPLSAAAANPESTTYLVVGPAAGPLDDTKDSITASGGTILQAWPQIGVVLAESDESDFAEELRGESGVQAVGSSRAMVANTPPDKPSEAGDPPGLGAGTSGGDDNDEGDFAKQWDMRMIGADKAHRVTDGSRDVTVGVLDSGIDATHPDLSANVDPSQSVGCTNDGKPDTDPARWQPTASSHGTHVAGSIAAARNGKGIVGVAPNVKLASIKVVDDGGSIYPEYAICGMLWAADKGMQVTNNSYYIDPWGLWCRSDVDQRAVLTAVERALAYTDQKNVVNVAAAGNSAWDLSKPIVDTGSPNNGDPVPRETDNNCFDLPTEAKNVITVSSVGPTKEKAYYSSYGNRVIDVTAPGGDVWLDWDAETPTNEDGIYSTIPGGKYGWSQGTSMASPHVAGVAALIRSTHPEWNAVRVRRAVSMQAQPMPCPALYDNTDDGKADAVCEGAKGGGFFGAGMVDALAAVTP
ncbi:MAG: S8 family serine peptidase [Propionibacteriales bacterium]|nr:S8 family serine peptidase [Propionibacteriales bacterium]